MTLLLSDGDIQLEWPGQVEPILVAEVSPGVYWISARWFDQWRERQGPGEDLEEFIGLVEISA